MPSERDNTQPSKTKSASATVLYFCLEAITRHGTPPAHQTQGSRTVNTSPAYVTHVLHAPRREKGPQGAFCSKRFSRNLKMFEGLFQPSTPHHILPLRPLIFLLIPFLTSRKCNTKALSRPSDDYTRLVARSRVEVPRPTCYTKVGHNGTCTRRVEIA